MRIFTIYAYNYIYLQSLNQALLTTNQNKQNYFQSITMKYYINPYFSVKIQSNLPKLSQSFVR